MPSRSRRCLPTILLACGLLLLATPLCAQEPDAPPDSPPAGPPAAPPQESPADPLPPARTDAAPPTPENLRAWLHDLESRYFDDRERAKALLIQAKDAAESAVRAARTSPDFRVRAAVAEIAGTWSWKTAAAVEILVELLSDEDAEVREAAVSALALLGPDAQPALAAARTQHPDLADAIDRICARRVQAGVERELLALITPSGGYGFFEGQFKGVVALGKGVLPVLLGMFNDPNFDYQLVNDDEQKRIVRTLAGEALADAGDATIVPELKRILDDPVAFNERDFYRADVLEDTTAYVLLKLGDPSYMQKLRSRLETESRTDGFFGPTQRRLVGVLVRMGEFDRAEGMYRKVIKLSAEDPEPLACYNLSCILALQGKKAEALEYLKMAVENHFQDFEWLKMDGDLQSLHGEEEFQEILRQGPKDPRGARVPNR